MNPDVEKKAGYKKYLTEGVVLAAVPIVAYLLNFTYDSGYGDFFRIPPTLTSFSLSTTFSVLSVVLIGLIFLANQLVGLIPTKKPSNRLINVLVDNAFALLVFIGIFWASGTLLLPMGIIFIVLFGFIIIRHFIFPLIWHYKTKGYRAKLRAHLDALSKSTRDTAVDFTFDFALFRQTTILILVVGVITSVFSLGFSSAKNQDVYYTPTNNPNWIVVRFIDDNVLLTNVAKNKQIGNELKLQSLVIDHVTLVKKTIGPLRRASF